MTGRIEYRETPEFLKDLKRLAKKFPTLEEDFELMKRAAIELYHLRGIDNRSVLPVPGYGGGSLKIFKVKKFACRSLPGKGVRSGLRVIYAFDEACRRTDFIEIYYKNDQKNENSDRIRTWLKGSGT